MSSSVAPTTTVEIDSRLLSELRAKHPSGSDRQLLEDLARVEIGFETLADVQSRNNVSPGEARRLSVRAVHETRAGAP